MKAWYIQNSGVSPELASWPAVHLRVPEVQVHPSLWIETPGPDEADGVVGVGGDVVETML